MPDLLAQITSAMPALSKSQREIGRFICDHYDKAAYMTAAKLGSIVGVSESTVVRFADGLGYDGYPELQAALRELIRTRLTALQRIEITSDRIGDSDVLRNVLTSDAEKIRETLDGIDRAAFGHAVELLISARKIYVLGARTSATLAAFLGFNLSLIFDNVVKLESAGGSEMLEQLVHIGQGDVAVAISFPRYSKRVVDAVKYSRQRGASVIGITDSAVSPIAENSEALLTAQSGMAAYVDSLVAPLSLINALIVAISQKKRAELDVIFGRLEGIWHDYDVYDK